MKTSHVLLPLLLITGTTQLFASVTAQLTAPTTSILVGQTLIVTATAKDTAAPTTRFSYQFTVRPHNIGPWIVTQDFYYNGTFPWTPSDHEGDYDIGVTAWSEATHNASPTFLTVHVASRVTGSTPVLSSTNNTLVALYSAPPCAAPQQMRVRFTPSNGASVYTPYKSCTGLSLNFYLGGLHESTTYAVQQFLGNTAGPVLSYTAGTVPSNVELPAHMRLAGPEAPTSLTYPYLLHATSGRPPYATDLYENVSWYRPLSPPYDSGYMVGPVSGGTFLTIDDDPVNSKVICKGAPTVGCGDHQFLRELDMAGNVIRSTSWSIVNDEVNALRATQGGSKVRLNFFSHEGIRLPNGWTATLATDEEVKTLTSGTQDMFGDVVVVLDSAFQVVWAWDAFDYLNINRQTISGLCVVAGPGCPSQYFNLQPNGKPYTQAIDWSHANSVYYDPSDRNLVVNFRNQSWSVKINFTNGTGNGDILWTFGYGGSFALAGGYPVSDWPSGEHDVRFQSNGLLTLFDNNNASTETEQPGGTAHGQAWQLDTSRMIATPIENIDLGVVSPAVGSARLLSNGNYHWQAGYIGGDEAQTFEFTPSGSLVYKEQNDSLSYRAFRMQDLYTAP